MLIDFVGNSKVLQELEQNIINRDISHAYLFFGSEGVGKYTAAKAFAKRILCGEDTISCKKIFDFSHPDLRIIRSEDTINKEDIERLILDAAKMPYESENKVFIVDGFDEFTIGAQNALLKTLEEPQYYLKIILIAKNINKILPTIISRTRIIKFKDVSNEEIEKFLINKEGIDEKNAHLFSRISVGSVKRAIRYSNDPKFLALRDKSIETLDRIINLKAFPFREYSFFKENEKEIKEIFNIFIIFLRDVALLKQGIDVEYVINIDKLIFLNKQTISSSDAISMVDEIINTSRLLSSNTNFELTIEKMLIKIGGI
ncbi:ATP-binding protein [Peptoniphilus sp. oral taxon 386]|uniref:DNA polymerase III subunit n=1 Tax=Peptoniphilus sp. oral taxon 386 TaxID=652713 RepID=UPI0001DA9E59|nr:AAA family ATPase [Peptoniphilus sp. oral taxon 386]EFI41475.1 DNA polymerase III, delta' subunit family protein [Peptoniphilus sp. oral taxon 386 str. F0131]